jgi:L-iditol 2-dehydrogenase
MKQAQVVAPEKLVYRDIAPPVAGAGEVLIRVRRIGICGSDLHAYRGKHPLVSFPLVQGHEFSGYLEAVGSGVTGLKHGDLVTVQPAIGCGVCPRCAEGLFAECDKLQFIGGALPGAGSQLYSVRADHVVRLPDGTDPDDGAMIEPLSVAVHSVRRLGEIKGRFALVIGGGTIGNLTAQVAVKMGAAAAAVMETNDFRRGIAEKLGLVALKPGEGGEGERIRAALGGHVPDVVFECVGGERPLNLAIEVVRRGGGVVVVGVYEEPPRAAMISVQDKEILLAGALMYTWDDYHTAVDLVSGGGVRLGPLRTHHFPFERWADAYRALIESSGKTMKVMIDV